MRPPLAFLAGVIDVAHSSTDARVQTDLRRAIPRHVWLASRARNALRRPAFIGAISVATFVTAIVSIVVAPRLQQAELSALPVAPRPDTLSIVASLAAARARLDSADSALTKMRVASDSIAALPPEEILDVAARDSIVARVQRLETLLARAELAPLPASYKALAASPEVKDDPRVTPLLDSLVAIERDRDGIASVGGVDPVFVELTNKLNDLGKGLHAVATERRNALLASAAIAAPVATAPKNMPDTARLVAGRDSTRAVIADAEATLGRQRVESQALDRAEASARERATAVAPPLAMLAAAFALSGIVGFAVAFVGELRTPRVTDAAELERHLGVRVLATLRAPTPTPDRGRREADRAAPPYLEPNAEGYQLAYLALANEHPTMLMAMVTGDDPAITAVVACNLAAIAADEARNTLVVDLDPSRCASAALRARSAPGINEILRDGATWPAATVSASAGRDRVVDLVPYGAGRVAPEAAAKLLADAAPRMSRYYDSVILVARPDDIAAGLASSLPSPEFVYCAQPGVTPIGDLKRQLDSMRAAGAQIRGITLWDAERPPPFSSPN